MPTNTPPLTELLAELVVYDAPALKKIRLGSAHDGGYVVPALNLGEVHQLYSVGVGHNLDFEFDFRTRSRVNIQLFDPTVSRPAKLPAGSEFHPVGLGFEGQTLTTLFNFGPRPNLSRHRLWLKMDIEGWEWPTLEGTSLACLEPFEVLIIEFHHLTHLDAIQRHAAVLRMINHGFRLIHAHGNNYGGVMEVEQTLLPDCLEATYLRKDIGSGWRPNRQRLPGALDSPCDPGRADLDLNCWPFVARPRRARSAAE
jgi:hypothetical protein